MSNVQHKIPIDIWNGLYANEIGSFNFTFPEMTHQNGKIKAFIKRCNNDLLLHTTFDPDSNSENIAALLTSVSLILNIPKITGEMHDVAVRDKMTNIVQEGSPTLLISDLPWDEFNRNQSPTIAISFDDAMCTWMGMRPIKSVMENHFHIDWNGISEAQRIWCNILATSLETLWLWLPPLEIPYQLSTPELKILKKCKISLPISSLLVVAYLHAVQESDKSTFFLKAALHPTTSYKVKPYLKVVKIKIQFKLKTGISLDVLFTEDVLPKGCISHHLKPFKYPLVKEFSLGIKLEDLDDKAIPVVDITLKESSEKTLL